MFNPLEVSMKIIAHRGLSSHAPENTIKAFELAGKEQRFFGIECDIHETKDHQFVVIHDENLKRMANVDQKIKDMTLNEIKSYLITSGNHVKNYPNLVVPTLEEYLEICIYYDKVAVIEIKGVADMTSLTDVINMIENHMGLKAMVISFNMNYLKYIRALSSEIELQLLLGELTEEVIYDARVNRIDLSLWYEAITPELVKRLKKEGFRIAVYTVNDNKEVMKLAKMGIDYLTTDQ
jgi:glycerophosphoryl diester phosphodiesterase